MTRLLCISNTVAPCWRPGEASGGGGGGGGSWGGGGGGGGGGGVILEPRSSLHTQFPRKC